MSAKISELLARVTPQSGDLFVIADVDEAINYKVTYLDLIAALSVISISREAGEDLLKGDPVRISANKFFKAHNVSNPGVVGIMAEDKTTGFSGTAITQGILSFASLTDGNEYFLGASVITDTAPTSGRVIKIGRAISTTLLLVEISNSVLLAA